VRGGGGKSFLTPRPVFAQPPPPTKIWKQKKQNGVLGRRVPPNIRRPGKGVGALSRPVESFSEERGGLGLPPKKSFGARYVGKKSEGPEKAERGESTHF